jgi:intracellular multiplication protein IcmQ
MANDDQEKEKLIELGNKLVESLKKLLDTSGWESSLFLRNIKKKLHLIQTESESLVAELSGKSAEAAQKNINALAPEGFTKVFVLVFQAEGRNLQIWRSLLKVLPQYGITRPIYLNEDHVRELVRSKTEIHKYGYVIALVNNSAILSIEKPSIDALGHELLTLREGALKTENIVAFIHANKDVYVLDEENNLNKLPDVNLQVIDK